MTRKATSNRVDILVVEDSPTQAEHLEQILQLHDYHPTVVRNGRQALAALRRRRFTLVVSDVVMPEMDGYELCTQIKREERTRDIPVILLTSLSDPADVVRGLESGADSFIFKPYDEQYLLARVSYILANRHLRASESAQMGVEVFFAGRKFFITSDRLQILNLLLSTYEAAVQKNRELSVAQDELRDLNDNLETKVAERTADLELEVAQRRQAQQDLQAQLLRLALLHDIARAVSDRQDLKSIFQVVVRSLEDQLPIDFGCVGLVDPATHVLHVRSAGAKCAALGAALMNVDAPGISTEANGLLLSVRGQLVYESDLTRCEFPFPRQLARAGLASMVIVPLSAEGHTFGMLVAARSQVGGFNTAECEFLQRLGAHVAVAAHQTRLHLNLQEAYDELRETQKAVMQQERLRALGQMASGVAHDINNAISPVLLYTESLLEQEQGLSEEARRRLVTIRRAVDDVAQTVARMREFHRPTGPGAIAAHVDLTSLVEHALELTQVRWRGAPQERGIVIGIDSKLAPGLPLVAGVDSEIRDALINLIFNAVDAMPDGGTLSLRTRIADSSGEDGRQAEAVRVEITDSGVGMDEETRRRCLEPFFTTKGERGSGLGLAMVYGMARRHDAVLDIDSEPGRGTTISLTFRIADAPARSVGRPAAKQIVRPQRILVIDDDPLLIESLCATLEGDGHVVTAVDGGQKGIDAYSAARARGEPFGIVITDLGMPYVDGRKVATAIKTASPATPVVLLTGWGQRLEAEGDLPAHVDRVLSKPPRLSELRTAIGELTTSGDEAETAAIGVA
ncbi:MAG: response regulator [Steroidobacteraceae bacterium]